MWRYSPLVNLSGNPTYQDLRLARVWIIAPSSSFPSASTGTPFTTETFHPTWLWSSNLPVLAIRACTIQAPELMLLSCSTQLSRLDVT
jgi:hypothetical protein